MRSALPYALIFLSGIAQADPTVNLRTGLDECFASARAADAICMAPSNDATTRLTCLQDARAAQVRCLEKLTTLPPPPDTPDAAPDLAAPVFPPRGVAPPALIMPAAPVATPEPVPPPQPPAPIAPGNRAEPAMPMPVPILPIEKTAPALPPVPVAPPARPASAWVVSETTSPIDYSPLISATIRSAPPSASDSFTIRCRGGKIELAVGTAKVWGALPTREIFVDVRIDREAPLRTRWQLSDDGRVATLRDDAAGLLRLLPDHASLSLTTMSPPATNPIVRFELSDLEAIRKRVDATCETPQSPPARFNDAR